jgi:Tol biopolymer transport system component
VAFCSVATNLTSGLAPGAYAVFVRDLDTSHTELVSVDSQEQEPLAFSGTEALALSGDGRYVAFTSDANNLAPGDTNTWYDVFVRDRQAGTTVLGSVEPVGLPCETSNGTQGLALSENGRYLAFHSQLLGSDSGNGREVIFLRDLQLETTELVSATAAGLEANGASAYPSLSADGRYVAFESAASDLIAGDTNQYRDIFVRDRTTHTTARASVTSDGAEGTSNSELPALSPDGRYVAFWSGAPNFVPEQYTPFRDAYVHDLQTGSTELASMGNGGEVADQGSIYVPDPVSISQDGQTVTFTSRARNLVAGDTNGTWDVFVRSRAGATTERVSVATGGAEGVTSAQSSSPALSGNGRYVAFVSDAFNLVEGDTNGEPDVFVWDRSTGVTERASVAGDGGQGNAQSSTTDDYSSYYAPAISADGRYVAFSSWASNLVPNDTNGWSDVFVRDRVSGSTERVSLRASSEQVISSPDQTPALSADGRYVAFTSSDDLVPEDQGYHFDVYVRDRATQILLRASGAVSGGSGDGGAYAPSLSADGQYVAFESSSTNLVPGDTNGVADVFVRDLQGGTTVRASVSNAGLEGNSGSYAPSLSGDGRYVAFSSDATNFMVAPNWRGVFVRDLIGGTTEQVNVPTGAGGAPAAPADLPRITADGRFVAFSAYAAGLVPDDTNQATDVFVRDRLQALTERVSVTADGSQGSPTPNFARHDLPAISDDGKYVAWQSDAADLVAADPLTNPDVYLRERGVVTPIQPPTGLAAQFVAPLRVRLTWTDPNADETGYRVERRTGPSGSFASLATLPADAISHEDNGVSPDTQYTYRVLAKGAIGDSQPASITIDVPGAPPAPVVDSPTRIANSGLRLEWSAGGQGLFSFRVERSVDDGSSWDVAASLPSSATSLEDTGLLPDHGYRYRVQSFGPGGSSPFGYAWGRTAPLVPAAPTGLHATYVGTVHTYLEWTAPAGPVSGYTVERQAANGAFEEIDTTSLPSETVFSLKPDTAYTFRVRAFNEAGSSAPSETATITTLGMPGKLVVSAKKVSFGTVKSGRTVQRKLVIKNGSRTTQLWIQAPTTAAPFGFAEAGTQVLAPGQTWKPVFTFTPTGRGAVTQQWTLTSSDPKRKTFVVTLTGRGK